MDLILVAVCCFYVLSREELHTPGSPREVASFCYQPYSFHFGRRREEDRSLRPYSI